MIFHSRTGTVIELDREAYRGLVAGMLLSSPRGRKVAGTLIAQGILVPGREPPELPVLETVYVDPVTNPTHLSAPETIHLSLLDKCNLSCSFCYADTRGLRGGLTLDIVYNLIDQMKALKVFQLAIGGGEPFLHAGLEKIVEYARRQKVVPNVTTNGTLVTERRLAAMKGKVGQLQFSVDDDRPAAVDRLRGAGVFKRLMAAMTLARRLGIPFGLNSLLTRDNIRRIVGMVLLAKKVGAIQIVFLRPKPGFASADAGLHMEPTVEQWRWVRGVLMRLCRRHRDLRIQVDCASSHLFSGRSAHELRARGVFGCVAGQRILAIKPNGDVYPCSHLSYEPFKAGNIFTQSIQQIWEQSASCQHFRRYRNNVGGTCGSCSHLSHCGGCPAISYGRWLNHLAGEKDCPN